MQDKEQGNRLGFETSPYLLQHANNPVDWYPWGEEAFQKAKKHNKPIFVSIGYSTCHWCHRMAKDCFEDLEVAEILNENFISIKVDREERPDIDQLYMNVCQMLTGAGGWPLHVFLTPQQLPFYAGTYFPKYSVGKQPGMLDILRYLKNVYTNEQEKVVQIGEKLKQELVAQSAAKTIERDTRIIDYAFHTLERNFDVEFGGFGNAPKFPNVSQLHYLMKYGALRQDEHAFNLVEKTLDQMYKGGIYDHLGGGFARYSTDTHWLVPHFEKMLYDQALLLMIYAEGYQKWKKPVYKHIIEDIFRFLQREMRGEDGNYYSAIDADSEGREGAYYLWGVEELPIEFIQHYGAQGRTHLDGQYVLNLIDHPKFEHVAQKYLKQRQQLLQQREQRCYPHVDKKQLTGWNALLVASFAKAGTALQNEVIVQQAIDLMRVLEQKHCVDGRLKMTANSEAFAYLDDYSYMLWAYNELYFATQNKEYIEKAHQIANYIIRNFSHEDGGFTTSSTANEQLIVNQKSALDAALPAGNGVLALQLHRLGHILQKGEFEKIALQQLETFSYDVMNYPTSALTLLQLEIELQAEGRAFNFSGEVEDLISLLQQQYRPFDTWTTATSGNFSLQICQHYSCLASIQSVEQAREKIIGNS